MEAIRSSGDKVFDAVEEVIYWGQISCLKNSESSASEFSFRRSRHLGLMLERYPAESVPYSIILPTFCSRAN